MAGRRLIFDAGSGIIPLGNEILKSKNKAFSLFFTHFHLDHFYGMNYFKPLYDKNCEVVFIGSTYGKGSLKKNMEYVTDELVQPVSIKTFPCKKNFIDVSGGETLLYLGGSVCPCSRTSAKIGDNELMVKTLYNNSHSQLGVINYRVEYNGKVFVFATDVECDANVGYNKALAEFASGADLLAMDGQYTDQEYSKRVGWGHSTYKMACRTAEVAGVKKLLIIHHDPEHDDKILSKISKEVKAILKYASLAREGFEVVL